MVLKVGLGNKFIAVEEIMELEEAGVLQLELKYCERCGGLWLRVRGIQNAYCSSCTAALSLSETMVVHKSKRPPRLPVRDINSHTTGSPLFLRGGLA